MTIHRPKTDGMSHASLPLLCSYKMYAKVSIGNQHAEEHELTVSALWTHGVYCQYRTRW